jgi:Uma2 family endonuclease
MGNRDRGKLLLPVVIQQEPDTVRFPFWVIDHASYRRWAESDEFPERGQFAYLDGEIWVDTSMERLGHNQIKTRFASVLTRLADEGQTGGHFLGDRMLLTNEEAGLSTEPDGMYIVARSYKSGKVRLSRGEESLEVEGTPDMVLEVVSPTSVQKDTVVLRDLYWRAGVPEYWLVETDRDELVFHILRRGAKGYVAARRQGGWLKSAVFGRSFRLTRGADQLGLPTYKLDVR